MTVPGRDSAVPQPGHYQDGDAWWGFYVGVAGATPHVWTRDEVKALSAAGGVAIVVPPQDWPWPARSPQGQVPDIPGTMQMMIAAAHEWGVPVGAPLCFDLEPGQGDLMATGPQGQNWLPSVRRAFLGWCENPHTRFDPWIYAAARHHATTPTYRAWLAEPDGDPTIPAGYVAKQYGQSPDGGVDLDVAVNGLTFMATDLDGLVTLPAPPMAPPVEKEEPMAYLITGTNYVAVVDPALKSKRTLAHPDEEAALRAAVYLVLAVPVEMVDRLPEAQP